MLKLKVGQRRHLLYTSNHCIGSWCIPLITCPSLVGVKGTDYAAKAESLSSPPIPLNFDYAFFSRGRTSQRIGPRNERPIFSNLMNRTRRPDFSIEEKKIKISDPRGTLLFTSRKFLIIMPLFNDRR